MTHGALEQTGTQFVEGETVKRRNTSPTFGNPFNDSQKTLETENAGTPNAKASKVLEIWLALVQPPPLQDEPTVKVFNEMNFECWNLGNHELDGWTW